MIDAFDAPVTLRQIPTPGLERGEVLVRVRVAGLNAADSRLRHGAYENTQEHHFPITLGFDMAGVVERTADGVERFRSGDEVYGTLWKQILLDGTFAEELLIIGATGSVGSFATQFAAAAGVHVIATARAEDEQYARGMGAAETVDYTAGDTVQIVKSRHPRGIDGLLDLVNRSSELSRVATVLHDGGRLATSLYAADPVDYRTRGIEATNIDTKPSAELLAKLSERLEATRARVPIAAEFPLEKAAAALECGEKKHPLGHIVLAVS
jgi:NADPH2:quinone reductase